MIYRWLPFLMLPLPAIADTLFVTNVPNGCLNTFNTNTYLHATFTRSQYQCNTDYYLPANTDHCVLCPDVYDCNGGTFTFDENENQGATFKTIINTDITDGCEENFLRAYNNTANITAMFTPNQHTCSAGYYLPANTDECRPCLKDNKCIGGTYSFNETNDQGIEPCPNDNKYAPSGSAICYPRRMHIDGDIYVYLKSTPSTDPALNVNVNGTMYHANLVRDEIPMNKDTDRFLPVTINGVQYFACDDTSCPSAE